MQRTILGSMFAVCFVASAMAQNEAILDRYQTALEKCQGVHSFPADLETANRAFFDTLSDEQFEKIMTGCLQKRAQRQAQSAVYAADIPAPQREIKDPPPVQPPPRVQAPAPTRVVVRRAPPAEDCVEVPILSPRPVRPLFLVWGTRGVEGCGLRRVECLECRRHKWGPPTAVFQVPGWSHKGGVRIPRAMAAQIHQSEVCDFEQGLSVAMGPNGWATAKRYVAAERRTISPPGALVLQAMERRVASRQYGHVRPRVLRTRIVQRHRQHQTFVRFVQKFMPRPPHHRRFHRPPPRVIIVRGYPRQFRHHHPHMRYGWQGPRGPHVIHGGGFIR